jgi:hypothetical protein
MKEQISRKNDRRVYQPRIQASRIKDLYEMKELTKRPMTVLVDEALCLYLSTFFSSPDYQTFQRAIPMKEEKTDKGSHNAGNEEGQHLSNQL